MMKPDTLIQNTVSDIFVLREHGRTLANAGGLLRMQRSTDLTLQERGGQKNLYPINADKGP